MSNIVALQNFIETLVPWGIFVTLAILLWKVPVWKTKIEGKIENLEVRLDKLETRLDKFEEKFDRMYHLLIGVIDSPLVKDKSPITLTDYGATISEKIHTADIANDYAHKSIEINGKIVALHDVEYNTKN